MHLLNKIYTNLIVKLVILFSIVGSFGLLYMISSSLKPKDNQNISVNKLNEKIKENQNANEEFYYNDNYIENDIEKIINPNKEKISKLTINNSNTKTNENDNKNNIFNKLNDQDSKETKEENNNIKVENNDNTEGKNNDFNKENPNSTEENINNSTEENNDNISRFNKNYKKYYEFNDGEQRDENSLDIFSMISPDYKELEINKKNNDYPLPKDKVKFCDIKFYLPPESIEGNKIVCPVGFSIKIHDVFYGRRPDDKESCSKNEYGVKYSDKLITVKKGEYCESHPLDKVKTLCENKRYCYIKPMTSIYGDPCQGIIHYMEVTYQCVKDENAFKKPKFAIVMFADNVKPNSVYEHSISEFAQYADVHGYHFFMDDKMIDTSRQVYYQKLYSVMSYVIQGLKTKSYDWIFWADSDSSIINPNISLDSFIPPEDKDEIHFIISDDFNGLNAGMFLIRVHPWSLSFLMKACTYTYYNKDTYLLFVDQSALLHILVEQKEDKHYIIVPQNWFNSYFCDKEPTCQGQMQKGDLLVHYAGLNDKKHISSKVRDLIRHDNEWYSKTSQQMR